MTAVENIAALVCQSNKLSKQEHLFLGDILVFQIYCCVSVV
jgi:hypothetical protein